MSGKLHPQNPIYLVLFILMIISCPNDQMRDLVELKVSDPLAETFIINSGGDTSSLTVTLNSDVSKDEDALEMRFKNAGYDWSDWESYSDTKTWTIPIGDGEKTVYAEYRDEGHHVVSKVSSIILDTGAPVVEGFYIFGSGTETGQIHNYINSRNSTLVINVEGADWMKFSNTDPASWDAVTPAVAYSDSYSWTLSSGDGEKTVYAQFLDNAGLADYHDYSIILDETPPAASGFTINSNAASAANTSVLLNYDYTETNELWAEYRNDGDSWWPKNTLSAGGGSVADEPWPLRAETGTRTVYVRLTDIAGNVSSVYSDDIYLDTAAPAAPTVTSLELYTASTLPEWTWNSVPGAVSYRYNLDNTGWSEEVPFTSYTPGSDLAANTSHTLYVRAVDSEGRESESGSFTVYIDTEAPVLSGMSLNQTYFKTGDTVVFNFTADDISGIDISSSMILLGSKPLTLTNISGSAYQAVTDITGYLADDSYPVEIDLIDPAGNYIFNSFSAAVIDNTDPLISNFTINNGNSYSCSPYGRVSITVSDAADLTMQLTGTSSTSVIPYADSYDIQNSGTVTGEFTDKAGNVSSAADSITMKTTEPEDTRYENQSMPSHIGEAAYDLGSASDWDYYSSDFDQGFLDSDLFGKATLWDEDWYKIILNEGYDPKITITADSPLTNTTVRVYYDSAATQPADFTYDVSGDGLTGTVNINWDHGIDGEKTIWIKIYNSGEYYGNTYDMEWFITLL